MIPLPEGNITSTIGMKVWAFASIVEVLNLSLFGSTTTSEVLVPTSFILLSSIILNLSNGCYQAGEVVLGRSSWGVLSVTPI